MPFAAPSPLPQNRHLAFMGESIRRDTIVPAAALPALLTARNPHGKPNADVLRRVIGADTIERWIVDFPPDWTEAEAALYEEPFAWLGERLAGENERFWHNPAARPTLRAALARLTRYLATPPGDELEWTWLDPELLPDESLLVVARDDDFAHGLLSSHWFQLWWDKFHEPEHPERAILSFPFPWLPEDRCQLTREQDEAKYALNRAARAGDAEAIDAAAALAYGWRQPPADDAALEQLLALHARRRDHP